ncbi:MAG: F0F1 ATP synthase subunit delta [Steroidobacterales bacterium]
MTELATTARPYARAAFASAGAASQLGQWSTFLGRAAAAVQDPRVLPLVGNPRVPLSGLVDFLMEVATGGKPQAGEPATEQRNFLHLLADNRRLKLLPEIAAQFEVLRAEAERIADVEVTSAQQLSAEQAKQLQAVLERRLGLTVRLHPQVDKSLLGGAIVRYGDFVVDGSLRGRIERLGAALSGA